MGRLPLRRLGDLFLAHGLALLALVVGYQAYTLSAQAALAGLREGAPLVESAIVEPDCGDAGPCAPGTTGNEAATGTPTDAGRVLGAAMGEGTDRRPLALAAAPPPPPASPPLWFRLERLGISSKVVELGTEWKDGQLVWQTADNAVGHYENTAFPGEGSNIVVSGHISSPLARQGQVFKRLPEVHVGDEVVVATEQAFHRYRVVSKEVVLPTETRVMMPPRDERLTIITCVPDFVYSHRLIVTAEPVDAWTPDPD